MPKKNSHLQYKFEYTDLNTGRINGRGAKRNKQTRTSVWSQGSGEAIRSSSLTLLQSPAEQNGKQKLSKMSHWGIKPYYYTWYR